MWLVWVLLGAVGAWVLFSGTAALALMWLLSGAPEQPPHRTGGKPWET